MCTPNLNCDAQAVLIKERSNFIAKRMQAASLQVQSIELAYQSTYKAAISYSLPATFMTRGVCNKIQAAATRIFLAMKGFNPNFPRIMGYSPKEIGGHGLMTIHTKQGTEGTLMLLKHIRAETKLGEMMETSEAWNRVWAGTGEGCLEIPKSPIPP